jgi:anti-anti-sigma regulatory factor
MPRGALDRLAAVDDEGVGGLSLLSHGAGHPGFGVLGRWLLNAVMPSSGVTARDHWCVAHDDGADLAAVASRYLSEGLTEGEQVGFYGWGSNADDLRAPLKGLGDVDQLIGAGAARARSLTERFRPDEPPDPAGLVAYWADATEQALDAGFSGLRVVADTTPWAGLRPDERAVFLRGEQLVNRYRQTNPFTLICACDTSVLPGDALAETASIHPQVEGVSSPFCLYATGPADFALQGEIEALTVPLLERVLESMPHHGTDERLVIDASDLRFIEHRSLLSLERHAERAGFSEVVLRNGPRVAARVAGLLDLRRVQPQGAS